MIKPKSEKFRENLLIITLSFGVVAGVMSSSMINLVVEDISLTFNSSFSTIFLRNTLFFTFFSSSLIFFGRIADAVENKMMYLCGILLFIISCVFSYISIHLKLFPFFLFSQSFQALSDAIILSALMSLIRNHFVQEKLGWAFGIFSAILSSATLFAPVVGALITKYFNWSYIFIFQIIFSVITYYSGYKYIPKIKFKFTKFNFNWTAFLMLVILMLSLQLFIITKNSLLEVISMIFFLTFSLFFIVLLDKKNEIKIFPEEIYKNKKYILSCFRIFIINIAANCFWMLSPSMLQSIYKLDIFTTSCVISVNSFIVMLLSKKYGKKSDKETANLILIGTTLPVLGLAIIYFAPLHSSSIYLIFITYFILGLSSAISTAASNKVVILSIQKENTGRCMGFFQFLQFSSGAFSASLIYYFGSGEEVLDREQWRLIIFILILIYIFISSVTFFKKNYFKLNESDSLC